MFPFHITGGIMKIGYIIICLGILILMGCTQNVKYGTISWDQRYSGGDGSTLENAVIVSSSGANSEQDMRNLADVYLEHYYGSDHTNWSTTGEMLERSPRHYYIATVSKDGILRPYYFDITSFYSRPAYQP